MTIPTDAIWEAFLTDALEVIPEGVTGSLDTAMNYSEWREKGGYHVTECTKLHYAISCASREFGYVTAKETKLLFDQCLEHRLILVDAMVNNKAISPSWLLVTGYYWCVFLALAWLRLAGKLITYLPSDEIDRLAALCAHEVKKRPGNGTFVTDIVGTIGARTELKFRRLKTNNFHEGLWNTFNQDIKERLKAAGSSTASWETRLFSALRFENSSDHHGWISRLRNIVNYRVGFGYRAVDGTSIPDILPLLHHCDEANVQSLIAKLEEAQSSAANRPVSERPAEYCKVMLLFGTLLTRVLEGAIEDVWKERKLDKEWLTRRKRYVGRYLNNLELIWPQ